MAIKAIQQLCISISLLDSQVLWSNSTVATEAVESGGDGNSRRARQCWQREAAQLGAALENFLAQKLLKKIHAGKKKEPTETKIANFCS